MYPLTICYYSLINTPWGPQYMPIVRVASVEMLAKIASVTLVYVLYETPTGYIWEPLESRANDIMDPFDTSFELPNIAKIYADAVEAARVRVKNKQGHARPAQMTRETDRNQLPRLKQLPQLNGTGDLGEDELESFHRARQLAAQWAADKKTSLGYFIEPNSKEAPQWRETPVNKDTIDETIALIHRNNKRARQFYLLDDNKLTWTKYAELGA